MSGKQPNFILIGSPKSGTTSVYEYLKQHPDIFLSENKEPKFFSFLNHDLNYTGHEKAVSQIMSSTPRTWEEYLKLFDTASTAKIIGEASPIYFHFPGTAENIANKLPEVKLAVILRNPVDRLYADWKHNIRMGWEPIKNFEKALNAWEDRKSLNWFPYLDYLPKGMYGSHLQEFLKYFDRSQIHVMFYEDLKKRPNELVKSLFRFLNVADDIIVDTTTVYMKGTPIIANEKVDFWANRFKGFFKRKGISFLTFIPDLFLKSYQIPDEMPAKLRKKYTAYFKKDIHLLERLLDKDLSHWYA